jgi:hypothetical protein
MDTFGNRIALEDKKAIIDDRLDRERDKSILELFENTKKEELIGEEHVEVLEEYKTLIREIILEKENQILAFNKILMYLDNISHSDIERKEYQKDEDTKEIQLIKSEQNKIYGDLSKYYKIVD